MLTASIISQTRHNQQYGISSFVYQIRSPFHPDRFKDEYINKYFVFVAEEEEEDEEDAEGETPEEDAMEAEATENDKKDDASADATKEAEKQNEEPTQNQARVRASTEEKEILLKARQEEAVSKQSIRSKEFGMLLRSKGFLWMANHHDLYGVVSQAANMVTLDAPGVWNALKPETWSGTEEEKKELRKHWEQPWGDRHQELVFIGQDLNHSAIQMVLDSCLLTDEQFAMGLDGWKATMGDVFLGAAGVGGEVSGAEGSEDETNKK